MVSVREFDAAYRFMVSESSKCDCVEEKLFVLDNWMEHFVLKKEKWDKAEKFIFLGIFLQVGILLLGL